MNTSGGRHGRRSQRYWLFSLAASSRRTSRPAVWAFFACCYVTGAGSDGKKIAGQARDEGHTGAVGGT